MTDNVRIGTAHRLPRRRAAFGLLAVAAVATTGWALVLPPGACGCTTPPDLVVINRSPATVTVTWRAATGLLGTPLLRVGGNAEAPACQMSTVGLTPGDVTADVTAGADRRVLGVKVGSDRAQPSGWIVVDPHGRISDIMTSAPAKVPLDGENLCAQG